MTHTVAASLTPSYLTPPIISTRRGRVKTTFVNAVVFLDATARRPGVLHKYCLICWQEQHYTIQKSTACL